MEEITEAEIDYPRGITNNQEELQSSLLVSAREKDKNKEAKTVTTPTQHQQHQQQQQQHQPPVSSPIRCQSKRHSAATATAASTGDSHSHTQHAHCSTSKVNATCQHNNHNGGIAPMAMYSERGVGNSPKRMVSTLTSPIIEAASVQMGAHSVSREHALKHEIDQLQEQLKDTEERLAAVRVQNDSLSQTQRSLRDQNARLQEESEMLKLDVQHLNECAVVLRTELQAARRDRTEAIELQRQLRTELDEAQQERKRAADSKEKDGRIIQDLQRQCREMERILIRKHPDSVSALIVAAKTPGICSLNDQENVTSRRLLEQRIAQLESDAKDQDRKAQQILANVQARFNSVQAKYETHIADLETQVLSLQEINTKLNEQIESQVRTLDRYMQHRADRYYNNCTQTDHMQQIDQQPSLPAGAATTIDSLSTGTQTGSTATRDHSTNTIGCPTSTTTLCMGQQQQHQHQHQHQHHSASSSTSSTANSTPNTSRPNSKQSGGLRRPGGGGGGGVGASATANVISAIASKLPVSQSDSTLSLLSGGHTVANTNNKEDAQLASTVRSMRVDLAIKNKAMQRLTRELDECKRTIRKLQRDRDTATNTTTTTTISPSPSSSSTAAAAAAATNATAIATTSNSHSIGNKMTTMDGIKSLVSNSSSSSNNISTTTNTNTSTMGSNSHIPASTESQSLKEAQNKYRLLEADYKTLHEKRLHDLKTLQSAHDRELASCNETVRILQQRLSEREEAFVATQKRRKIPVDYYALKAKVSLLERRHSEREERLHMLVEALSKGRLNGALEDLIQENNNK